MGTGNRIKQRRAWLLLGWVTADRSCPCKRIVCPAIGGGSEVTSTPLVRSSWIESDTLPLQVMFAYSRTTRENVSIKRYQWTFHFATFFTMGMSVNIRDSRLPSSPFKVYLGHCVCLTVKVLPSLRITVLKGLMVAELVDLFGFDRKDMKEPLTSTPGEDVRRLLLLPPRFRPPLLLKQKELLDRVTQPPFGQYLMAILNNKIRSGSPLLVRVATDCQAWSVPRGPSSRALVRVWFDYSTDRWPNEPIPVNKRYKSLGQRANGVIEPLYVYKVGRWANDPLCKLHFFQEGRWANDR
ncbi:hypothetical protein J6590_078636, partial [Homalodisca vitripennis]